MNNSRTLLTSILKTAQMGQVGIRSVKKYAVRIGLVNELNSQLAEYDAIEREAYTIAESKGWELSELDKIAKGLSALMARSGLYRGCTDSKIASMMIQGNTRGMIKSLRNKRQFTKVDNRVAALSQKLLDCERENIKQMQGFL